MAARHLVALGLGALLWVSASSATAGFFRLIPQSDPSPALGIGDTLTFDVVYRAERGDPPVLEANLRVIFSTQFSVVSPSASATGVFDSPVALILTTLFGVEIGGAQLGGVGISFTGLTKLGEIVVVAVGPGRVDLFNDPAFTGAFDENLVPIGDSTAGLLATVKVRVPEAGSMLLLGMGLGALAFVRRRA